MYPQTDLGGEGASTPDYALAATSGPLLVVWPMMAPSGANAVDASRELYRLAYEWAQAVLHPSRYERACRVVLN
jgi:hypothetical protein